MVEKRVSKNGDFNMGNFMAVVIGSNNANTDIFCSTIPSINDCIFLDFSYLKIYVGITFAIIIISYGINALADAIDHLKGARCLYETWHILKGLSYGLLFACHAFDGS